ncbi:BPSL0761 family protein [Paraburkholderia sp. BL6669N2]|uniref:BPSL0761 family protein n=1 Tax=Paraburkholderia sp. BL6669N2 TaxID=1938807 RepID=UPI002868604E|nr:BPSL0761 family protein [Paraburkholderia sp. BL6669N2]
MSLTRLIWGTRMTTAEERTRAVVGARDLLATLADGRGPYCADLVRTLAMALLRHFPSEADIDASAFALPNIWAESALIASRREHRRRGQPGC